MDKDTDMDEGKDKGAQKGVIVTPVEWGSKDEDLRDVIAKEKGTKRKK